jgi:electron transport complex protein RnfC
MRKACVPAEVLLPLRQHAGEPAACLVSAGQFVDEGQLIGRGQGPRAADVHASIPGVVRQVREMRLPDGAASLAVLIALQGEFRLTGRARRPLDWKELSREQLLQRLEEAGVVGPDGVPAASRLREAGRAGLLVVSGVESEPYLSCGQRIMVEKAPEVLSGAAIAASILGAGAICIGVEANKPDALQAATAAAEAVAATSTFGIEVIALDDRYPLEEESLLLRSLAGCRSLAGHRSPADHRSGAERGPGGRPSEQGSVVLEVGTLLAIFEAVTQAMPQIERVVTVAGEVVRRPGNLKARLGTAVSALLEECGLLRAPARVIAGGPMRGFALDGLDTPLTKGMRGILALSRREILPAVRTPCIGCGRCGEACPWGLRPDELYKWLEHGEMAEAFERGLEACTECGCCAFVCPARIPLVQGLAAGKRGGAA